MKLDSAAIALIEDDFIFRTDLEDKIHEAGLGFQSFEDLESFFSVLKEGSVAFDAIIVDRFLGHEDTVKGQFPKACRYYGYSGPIVLYSTLTYLPELETMTVKFDQIVNKSEQVDWLKVLTHLLEPNAVTRP